LFKNQKRQSLKNVSQAIHFNGDLPFQAKAKLRNYSPATLSISIYIDQLSLDLFSSFYILAMQHALSAKQ
jgi:hypothetical protein